MEQTKWQRVREYVFARLQEASFWRAIFILGGGSAALVDPAKSEAYMTLAMIGAGLIGILLPDNIPKIEPKE